MHYYSLTVNSEQSSKFKLQKNITKIGTYIVVYTDIFNF